MNNEDTKEMLSYKWMHELELEPGILTPATWKTNIPKRASGHYSMPEDLTGKTVLDIGCWDGGFSFEAEKRGAKVKAIDIVLRPTITFAKRIMKSNIEIEEIDFLKINPNNKYDVVFFYGVLYHLDNVYAAMDFLGQITKETCLIETSLCGDRSLLKSSTAICQWQIGAGNDPTNKWFPNFSFMQKIAKDCGFTKYRITSLLPNKSRATFELKK